MKQLQITDRLQVNIIKYYYLFFFLVPNTNIKPFANLTIERDNIAVRDR